MNLNKLRLKENVKIEDIKVPNNSTLDIFTSDNYFFIKKDTYSSNYVAINIDTNKIIVSKEAKKCWEDDFKFLEEYFEEEPKKVYKNIGDFKNKNSEFDSDINILDTLLDKDYIKEKTFTYYVDSSGDNLGDENDTDEVIDKVLDDLSKDEIEKLFDVVIEEE